MKVYKPKYSAATFDMARADYIAPPRLGAAYHSLTETGTIPSTADSESLRRLVLDEIPVADGSMRVTIAGTAAVLVPVGRTINAGDCEVDYDTGILTFNATDAGKAVSVTYKGNGSALMPQDMAKYPKYESDGSIKTGGGGLQIWDGALDVWDDVGYASYRSVGGVPKFTTHANVTSNIVLQGEQTGCGKLMYDLTYDGVNSCGYNVQWFEARESTAGETVTGSYEGELMFNAGTLNRIYIPDSELPVGALYRINAGFEFYRFSTFGTSGTNYIRLYASNSYQFVSRMVNLSATASAYFFDETFRVVRQRNSTTDNGLFKAVVVNYSGRNDYNAVYGNGLTIAPAFALGTSGKVYGTDYKIGCSHLKIWRVE